MGIHRLLCIPLSNVLVRNIVLSKEFARRIIEINDGVDITGAALSGGVELFPAIALAVSARGSGGSGTMS